MRCATCGGTGPHTGVGHEMVPHIYQPGNRVKYTAKFLQSIGWCLDVPEAGTVMPYHGEPDWIRVRWDDSEENSLVNVANIMPADLADHSGW